MASSAAERLTATAGGLLFALMAGSTLAGQDVPVLHAAFGAHSSRLSLPAIEWLCSGYLPGRPEWPRQQDHGEPFTLVLAPSGLEVAPSRVTLPSGVVAAGSCSFGSERPMVWSCSKDGTEDWFVPRDWKVPAPWRALLASLQADVLDAPRALDAAVVIGHLAGAVVDGDPRGELLRLGSALCGHVAWTAWSTTTHVRVRGRSGGGLLLPAILLTIASAAEPTAEAALALRAFAARDGDRAEAARQFSRTSAFRPPATQSVATLRALLHADDPVALAAIDALVRLRVTDELPQIIAAAKPEAPWASLAAADAVRELWTFASPAVRADTRKAIANCQSLAVRQIDLDTLPTRSQNAVLEQPDSSDPGRARGLVVLGLLAIGLYGMWSRQRALLRSAMP